jgi:hypothetical protein
MRVFISYRRPITGVENHFAVRVQQAFVKKLGKRNVFYDKISLQPGVIWGKEIEKEVRATDFLVVVIDVDWIARQDELTKEDDWVRLEIETALQADKTIVSMLQDSINVPDALHKIIGELLARNAFPISSDIRKFDTETNALIDNLRRQYSHRQCQQFYEGIRQRSKTVGFRRTFLFFSLFCLSVLILSFREYIPRLLYPAAPLNATPTTRIQNQPTLTLLPICADSSTVRPVLRGTTYPYGFIRRFSFLPNSDGESTMYIQVNVSVPGNILVENCSYTGCNEFEVELGDDYLYDISLGSVSPNYWYRVKLSSGNRPSTLEFITNTAGCFTNASGTGCKDVWFADGHIDSLTGCCGDGFCASGETCPADCGTATPSP